MTVRAQDRILARFLPGVTGVTEGRTGVACVLGRGS